MRAILSLAACAACGTHSFTADAPVAADASVPPASNGKFVSATVVGPTSGSVTVQIPPTSAGDQLDALLTGTLNNYPQSIVAGNQAVSLELGGLMPETCNRWAWTWHSAGLSAGISSVSITMTSTASFSGYLLAFSGLSGPVYDGDVRWGGGASSPAAAPSMPAGIGNVVVSLVGTCDGSVGDLVQPTPFTALPSNDGIDVAYLIPVDAGAYGAEWTGAGGSYVAVTRVLR